MKNIRVLIADDSFFMRKLLRDLIHRADDLEVVGEAKDGQEAVRLADELEPDVITMDYNMPKMTGSEAVREILAAKKSTPPRIIMLSAYTAEGADETLESLRAGAIDAIEKPGGELSLNIDTIEGEIRRHIRSAASATVVRRPRSRSLGKKTVKSSDTRAGRAVVISSSTGGPPVVEDILVGLPENFNAAVFVIQHMPAYFTDSFSRRLNAITNIHVKEAEDGETVRAGTAYIAPGDIHLGLKQTSGGEVQIQLHEQEPRHGLRPSSDVTMEDAAAIFGKFLTAVQLTGMGEDGASGTKVVHDAGGSVVVQEPSTAVIASMPQSVIRQDIANEILPPERISKYLIATK